MDVAVMSNFAGSLSRDVHRNSCTVQTARPATRRPIHHNVKLNLVFNKMCHPYFLLPFVVNIYKTKSTHYDINDDPLLHVFEI